MSATILKVVPKAGAYYNVTQAGAEDISLHYQVVLSAPLAANELITEFSAGGVSIPAIGTEHPARAGYYAVQYEVRQPEGADKSTLNVTVKYAPQSFGVDDPEAEEPVENNIEQWGWSDGTTDIELVTDMNGVAVLNSAGDPFDSVPNIASPSPTFTKVVRFKKRQDDWQRYFCTVNESDMEIGGISFAARTLLCTIVESLDPTNEKWPYKYSISIKYRSNKAKVARSSTLIECGWDVVVTDTGMRKKDPTTGQLKFITTMSSETDNPVAIASPELLDGNGQPVARSESSTPEPYNFRFAAYVGKTFPDWFTSEPKIINQPTPQPSTPNS